jgi:CRP/FNR family cyclic AMP-dependent transcriptional regulator
MSVVDTLRTIPLFSQIRESDLERIAQAARERTYPKNSVILFEDDPGDALYVVVSGQVKVVLSAEDGREVILSVRAQGDFFGEMSLIDKEPRSAHVIAMEDSKLLVLRREDFQKILVEMPQIALGLLRAMCTRLRQADDKIGGLVLLDVPGRVARLLLDMADENDGAKITKRVTHHMIAQMIGSSRTMRNMVEQGLIEASRKLITIANRNALEVAAGRPPKSAPEKQPSFDGTAERRRTWGGGGPSPMGTRVSGAAPRPFERR